MKKKIILLFLICFLFFNMVNAQLDVGYDDDNQPKVVIEGEEAGDCTTCSLDDLTDVNAPAPADGEVLTWDNAASEWIAQAVGAIASTFNITYDLGIKSIFNYTHLSNFTNDIFINGSYYNATYHQYSFNQSDLDSRYLTWNISGVSLIPFDSDSSLVSSLIS